ncbi:tetratricopeptide repeat protein [Pelobacter seleniigenes]|uniref:tetratricopeptide repeat protein n=1 Tax=Pelobacter seleniigenes TaxID=407188 RepID=UPI0004A6F573|nr:tetratricopeptide repeat protein [Pelobacter seleniigenes]
MNTDFKKHRTSLTLLVLAAALLQASCTPAPSGAPSYALKQQLQQLKQQQQEQAQQLQQLQQQLASLQLQPAMVPPSANTGLNAQQPAATPALPGSQAAQPSLITVAPGTSEASEVAASASTYLSAFSNLAMGRYAEAESGFAAFLSSYPDHQYASNARFWLANAQAAENKTALAVANLKQIVASPQGQDKAPAAMLQLIRIYRQTGLTGQAETTIAQLRTSYPDSPEAQQFIQSDTPAQ